MKTTEQNCRLGRSYSGHRFNYLALTEAEQNQIMANFMMGIWLVQSRHPQMLALPSGVADQNVINNMECDAVELCYPEDWFDTIESCKECKRIS